MDISLATDTKDYVVLLHGISRDSRIMHKLEQYLQSLGYLTYNESYPSTEYSVHELVKQIWSKIQKFCTDPNKKINFVVHSLGALIVRAIIAENKIPNLGRVVMLAPPNHGVELVDFLKRFSFYRKNYGPAGMQLGTSPNDFAQQLPPKVDFDVGIIAGNRSSFFDLPFAWFILPSKGDGKVTIASTKLDGMKDHIVVPASHPGIPNKKITAYEVAYFLKYDKFDHNRNC